MKYIVLCLLFPLVFQCCKNKENITDSSYVQSDYSKTLNKFKTISLDTLEIYSETEDGQNYNDYSGIKLDSNELKFFPKDILNTNAEGIFACYKFKIDSQRVALIARTDSWYCSSSIKLFVFDLKCDSIVDYIELAEGVGDAGYGLSIHSWIFKSSENKIEVFTWRNDYLDNSVEDSKDSSIVITNEYYLFNLSKLPIDTITKDSLILTTKFNYLMTPN